MQVIDVWKEDGSGLECRVDIENLILPNGDKAHLLAQPDLYHELKELGVPGVVVNMGRHELLVQYGRFLKADDGTKNKTSCLHRNLRCGHEHHGQHQGRRLDTRALSRDCGRY
jgi:hypothetical protein